MIICLKRKTDLNDKNALVVCVENGDTMFTKKMSIGDTLEVEDQLAYKIMAQYPNCFEHFTGKEKYQTKTMQAEK